MCPKRGPRTSMFSLTIMCRKLYNEFTFSIITAPAWAKIEDVPARPNGSSRDYREEELDLEVNSGGVCR